MTTDHPTDAELLQFVRGQLSSSHFEKVAAHVETCQRCAAALEKTGVFPNLLAAEARQVADTEVESCDRSGSTIDRYKLLQQLGEGGMGVVYMAEQEKPVRRQVALKIIKPGMDSRQVIARFEAERQALAMMDHHNIAKVLDAGTTDTGRPYFVMELVKGVPITEYCDRNKLALRERLTMFIPVCQAIQHAHQKGIIHRDVKPSNVLVTFYDGTPVPKVIDFGIAKATQQKLTERTMFTGIGQILGTLDYMSPEQAEINQLDVDTRSDVYSLGVMLYELLTGSTPITKEQLRSVGFEEMLRAVRETEPSKPSTRLSELGDNLPSVAAVRKTEPAKLTRLVRGDLDWIVMKALEKDRTRRYESASGLAADVQRFLNDDAVEACPPSAGYKLRRFARRNKTALAMGGTIAVILLAVTIVSSYLAAWAMRAQKKATENAAKVRAALKAEEEQRKLAEENEAKANSEALKSREVATFLKDMLNGVGPSVARGRSTRMLEEILEKTVTRLDTDLHDQPQVEADIRMTIANVYHELGGDKRGAGEEQARRALEIRKKVFGEDSLEFAESLLLVASKSVPNRAEALEMQRRVLEIRRRHLSGDHEDLVDVMQEIAFTLAWRSSNTYYLSRPNDPHLESPEKELAQEEAIHFARNALAMQRRIQGKDNLEVAKAINMLAVVLYHITPESPEMLELANSAASIERRLNGMVHPDSVQLVENLATYLTMKARHEEAEPLIRDVLEASTIIYGEDHPKAIAALRSRLDNLLAQGKFEEWEACFDLAMAAAQAESKVASTHDRLATLCTNRAKFLLNRNRMEESEVWLQKEADYAEGVQHVSIIRHTRRVCLGHYISGEFTVIQRKLENVRNLLRSRILGLLAKPDMKEFSDEIDAGFLSAIRQLNWKGAEQMLAQLGSQRKNELVSPDSLRALQILLNWAVEFDDYGNRLSSGPTESVADRIAHVTPIGHTHFPDTYKHLEAKQRAALFYWVGMLEDARRLRSELLDDVFANNPDEYLRWDIAAMSLLIDRDAARAGLLFRRAVEAAEKCWELVPEVSKNRGYQASIVALAAYRSGNYNRAMDFVKTARTSGKLPEHLDVKTSLIAAMVEHVQGRTDEGQRWFDQARRRIRPLPFPKRDIVDAPTIIHFSSGGPINWSLFEEARELIESN